MSVEKNEAQQRPNILFILADDLGAHDLGFAGSEYYETPNLDGLANRAFVFTNGYAASRVCSPSRASIMTGKFTARHGITDWIGAYSGEDWRKHSRNSKLLPASYLPELPASEITIAEALRTSGYKTFFAGKWHLGGQGSYPEDHGFNINVGGWEKGSPIGGFFSPWTNPKLENQTEGENLTLRLARETSNFIKENNDTPFFAFLSFYAVHAPIQTTQEKWRKYRDKAVIAGTADSAYVMESNLPIRVVQDNPMYAGLLETMDQAVGNVLKQLEVLGLEKNTIVIFTSDNGGVASGDAYSTSNLPLRGGKGYQWEGGLREPFLIHVPWLSNAQREIQHPVINTDFYPTILELAGLDLLPDQHIDGTSLKSILEGGELGTRPLFWHYPHYGNQGGDPSSIILKSGWKLIHYWEDGTNELYHLLSDPAEEMDVSMNNPRKTKNLFTELESWLIDVDALRPTIDPNYDEKLALESRKKTENEWLPELEVRRQEYLSDDFSPNDSWWGSKLGQQLSDGLGEFRKHNP
ncbi:MAG: sulfatase [Cyclobacteriaceae bacterium]